ncbi:Hsp70 family protein [Williamsia sp. CHRR-6]|uniref:Hsp70 family protein n=1 Tax=Williamsia sp. CHRR-6 TaxID=2835871 RepID=UPI001BD9CA4F|nr:Hsp70 family protein [Williamsia sp. CHRR-6]MBT0568563.1 Hsp70 family protein [Williamsia sp. CHRR-6]
MASEWILSVDFGTSNTAAAHSAAVGGAIESLALSHVGNLVSSSVFVESPDRIAVGEQAINEAQRNPAAFIPSPKRLVGQPAVAVNGYSIPVSLPISAVLRMVFTRAAAAHAGTRPSRLVLTHPEGWSPEQTHVLIEAAVSAGMPESGITLMSEPRAAAAHYARSATLADGARVAVFDFGGGTLDVAVLVKTGPGRFDVIAARGDNGLGGKNFDATIRQWVDEQLEARNPGLQHYLRRDAPVGVRFALDDSIRRAKELLSETPSATITVAGDGFREVLQLTRDELEELIAPAMSAAVNLARSTLADARQQSGADVEAIYLTGGTSRIPLVHQMLSQLGPVATLDDPKTVVAQGAIHGFLTSRPDQTPSVPTRVQPAPWGEPGRPVSAPVAGSVPAPAGAARSKRPILIGVGVAAVVAVVATVGFLVLGNSDSDGGSGTAASSAPSVASPLSGASTQEEILAVVPTKLRSDLQNCARTYDSTAGLNYLMVCLITSNSQLTKEVANLDSSRVTAGVDSGEAAGRLDSITSGTGKFGAGTLVDGSGKTKAARVFDDPNTGWTMQYADSASGLVMTVTGFIDAKAAGTFASRAGLF